MKKAEIKSRFDEIVAFAEVEKFIDTPVKHYSNGLYVRLAFAVAAHLEPEILLIDEVLAVGDTGFQRKCLGRMGTVAKDGRTVLFVSHQMNQIRRLCEKAIWLNSGRLQKIGMATEVVGSYESAMSSISLETSRGNHDEHVAARFLKWEIIESSTKQSNILDVAGPVTVEFTVKINRSIRNGRHGAALYNFENQLIWATVVSNLQLEPGICAFSFKLATLPVRPGVYYWYVSLYEENVLVDLWLSAPEMVVATKPAGHPSDGWQGLLNLPWKFTMRKE
jgi:lipopolysaccharide transport system ATP-binding protein